MTSLLTHIDSLTLPTLGKSRLSKVISALWFALFTQSLDLSRSYRSSVRKRGFIDAAVEPKTGITPGNSEGEAKDLRDVKVNRQELIHLNYLHLNDTFCPQLQHLPIIPSLPPHLSAHNIVCLNTIRCMPLCVAFIAQHYSFFLNLQDQV